MSDRIVVMNSGRIEQMGGAEEIYNEPSTRFVADFVGQINLFDAKGYEPETGRIRLNDLDQTVHVPVNLVASGKSLSIGGRPEDISLNDSVEPSSSMNRLDGVISGRTFAGNLTRLFVDVGLHKPVILEASSQSVKSNVGDKVTLGWPAELSKLLSD